MSKKMPWEITRSNFYREYVFHITKKELESKIRAEGVTKGSWMIGHVPETKEMGGLLIIAKRSEVECLGIETEDYKKGKCIRPVGNKSYYKGSVNNIIIMNITKSPHLDLIKEAISNGYKIPEKVLKDYDCLK